MVTLVQQDPARAGEQTPAPANPELDAIGREAAALEGAADAAGAPAASATNTAGELREALGLVRTIAAPGFSDWPAFGREVWTDVHLSAIADNGAAIMDRHGWTMGDMWSTWGPYIGLAGALARPGLATFAHLKQRKALALAMERARAQAVAGPAGQAAQRDTLAPTAHVDPYAVQAPAT